MIERVIRISAELEGEAIVDRKRLRQSSIEVHQSGTIERIAGSVSIRVLRRQREGITIDEVIRQLIKSAARAVAA